MREEKEKKVLLFHMENQLTAHASKNMAYHKTTIYITYIGNRISSFNYVLIVVYHSHVSLFEVVSKILVIIISQAYLVIEKGVYCEIPLREVPTALICSFLFTKYYLLHNA